MPLPCILHLDLGVELRGGQRQAFLLASWQRGQGLPAALVVPRGAPLARAGQDSGIPVHELSSRRGLDPRSIFALVRMAPPGCLLHTHEARAASLGAALRLLRPDIRVVHTRRVSYPLGWGWSRVKYALGHAVVAVGHEVAGVVRQAGVAVAAVIPSAIPVQEYSQRCGWNGGRVGIIGALSPQKGHHTLFQAVAAMASPPEVWVVGSGPLQDELKSLAKRLGVAGQVRWLGWVPAAQVLPQLDVLAVPSPHGEGSSGVIKEAWAAGVPVVCSDLPANQELVDHERTGLLVPVQDPHALAEALERILGDHALAQRLVHSGRSQVLAFDVPAMGAAYLRLYASLGFFPGT
jgi:glycosyltransferase involved in cell wall biosynthesis